MTGGGRRLMTMVLVLAAAGAARVEAESRIVLPRPGQVGVGVQGGWGAMFSSGTLGDDFSGGPTLAFRLRYRMRYERALGLSFENQRHELRLADSPDPANPNLPGRRNLNLTLSGVELLQMFDTRTRTPKMLLVGAGLAQTSVRMLDDDTLFPGDGVYVSAGAGVEHFFMRSWAFDVATRYVAVFHEGTRNHDVQAAVGFIFYASY